MKKILSFILVFLLSISVAGCTYSAPDTTGVSSTSEENLIGNYYKINGIMRDIGDYSEIEERFLIDYESQLNAMGILGDKVFIYDTADLTEEILENREGVLIIERCLGLVIDEEIGDGEILNCGDNGCYIAYHSDIRSGLKLKDGTVVVSYMVYDPSNNYIDDIMERYDFVLCREYED